MSRVTCHVSRATCHMSHATIFNKYVFYNIQQLLFTSNNPFEAFKRDFIIHLEKDPDFLFEKRLLQQRVTDWQLTRKPYRPHFLPVYMGRLGVASITAERPFSTTSTDIGDLEANYFHDAGKKKPAAHVPGADPSRCSSTNRQNPPIQHNHHNF